MPKIPTGYCSIGSKRLPSFQEIGFRGHFREIIQPSHGRPDAQVINRPNIRPHQAEHQKHLRRPRPDASHFYEVFDDLLVLQPVKLTKRQHAAMGPVGQIEQGLGLGV